MPATIATRRSVLRRNASAGTVLAAGALLTLLAGAQPAAAQQGTGGDAVTRGEYIFPAAGCASCHSQEEGKGPPLAGGVALKTPYGTFYTPNITPDPVHGIGKWSEADFVTAMIKGTAPNGQHLFPAFPYPSYQHMKWDDVRDLFAYLKTLPAVADESKPHDVPFPFNVRRSLGVWKFLFLDGKTFTPDPAKDAVWNRGAYLVNGPGHCAECHSPRNFLGGIKESQRFAGGPEPGGDGFVPNITQKGLSMSYDDLLKMLTTGETPDGDTVGGEMGKVVANTGKLGDADRAAIATYVKSLPPVEGPRPPESK